MYDFKPAYMYAFIHARYEIIHAYLQTTIHTTINAYAHTYMHTHLHTYNHTNRHTHTHKHAYMHTSPHPHTCRHLHSTHMHLCVSSCSGYRRAADSFTLVGFTPTHCHLRSLQGCMWVGGGGGEVRGIITLHYEQEPFDMQVGLHGGRGWGP